VYPDGRPFVWRGVTAFRLVDHLADGRELAATAYLDWARDTGFTLVRTLSTVHGWADLAPEAGASALPRLLELAAARGLYVEVVAVGDSSSRRYDWRAHARRVAGICAAAPNCLFEFANEPGHGAQDPALADMAAVDQMAADAVRDLPHFLWTAGSAGADTALVPTGRYVVRHLDRGGEPLLIAGRVRELGALSAITGKFTVNDEPIGADELDAALTGRQRVARPEVFYAMAVLCRLFEVGCTFHLEDGLATVVPGPVQQEAARDFIEASRLLPEAGDWQPIGPTDARSPARRGEGAEGGAILSIDSFVDARGASSVTVVLHSSRVTGPGALVWRAPWKPVEVLGSRPHVTVWRATRQ
jgi:hypothetical protein